MITRTLKFTLINNFSVSCDNEMGVEKVQETLDFLVDYAVNHFYEEEKVQVQYNYPGYKEHKKLHEDFKATVGELITEFKESGCTQELGREINSILAKWVVQHILNEDKKIGKYLKTFYSR